MSWLRRSQRAPAPPPSSTALRQIAGHVAMTATAGTAWYRPAPVSWSFRPDRDREGYLLGHAAVLAQLTGKHVHIRGTSTPFPVRSWAQAHHELVVAAGRPYNAGPLPGWPDLLEGEQRSFLGEHLSEKEVFFGVEFLQRSAAGSVLAALAPARGGPLSGELSRRGPALSALDTLMARPGMAAAPVSGQQMAWLLHRSALLGFPAPARRSVVEVDQWDSGDLADLLTEASWSAEPFATTMKITAVLDGRPVTRHVAVLTVGRMQPMDIPRADQPWMCVPDSLGIPLEWSAHVYPRADKDVLAEIRRILGAIASQTQHYTVEHGLDAPSALADQREQALTVERELTALADPSLSRAQGWWRVAVSGADEAECLDAAERVIARYGRTVEICHTFGQVDLAREFMPGGRVRIRSHVRKMPLRTVAAAGAAVTSSAGDRMGWNIGRAAQDGSPVMFDLWRNMETYDVSGLYLIIAGLGGGKTTLMGSLVAKTAMAGVPWCVIDPAGKLGRLGRTAPLRAHAQSIDMLSGSPGLLNPYALVREPAAADFDEIDLTDLDDDEAAALGIPIQDLHQARLSDLDPRRVAQLRTRRFNRAVIRARATRTRLCLDSLLQILPAQVASTGPDAGTVATELRLAAQQVADPAGPFAGRPAHPGLVIEALRNSKSGHRPAAVAAADLLDSLRHEPQCALLFPEDDAAAEWSIGMDRQLTFLSTKGLVLPDPGTKPEYWQDESRQGVAILNLTSWLALRWLYQLPPGQRKGVGLDEVHFLMALNSGRLMLNEFARNTRKQNAAVLAAGQDPGDGLESRGMENFVGGAFLGRMDDSEAAARALRIAQVTAGVGYENVLLNLPRPSDDIPDMPRQFLFYSRGGRGFKEIIQIDRGGGHLDWMWRALETAPGQEYTRSVA